MVTIVQVLEEMRKKGLDPNEWQIQNCWENFDNHTYWGFDLVQGKFLQREWENVDFYSGDVEYGTEVYERFMAFDNKHGWLSFVGKYDEKSEQYDYFEDF